MSNAYDKRMIHHSFAFQLEIELGHGDAEGLEEVQGVTELESEGVLVNLAENYEVWSCGFFVLVVAVIHEDEIFDGGLLDPSSEVESV